MIDWIIVITGCLVSLLAVGAATWSFIDTSRRATRARELSRLKEEREADKNTGMSTVDHILWGTPDGVTAVKIASKISALTSRSADYNPTVYQEQKNKFNGLRNRNPI